MVDSRLDGESLCFEIEVILDVGGQIVIFARILAERDFAVREQSRLGGHQVVPALTQPRALRPDGAPRTDLYAFCLRYRDDAHAFRVGQQVLFDE